MLKLLLVCACISIAIDVGFAEPEERSHCKYQHYTNNSHLCFFMSPNFGLAWIEGTAIFVAVFVVAFVGSWNDYQKELQFLKLQAISDKDNIVRSHKLTVQVICRRSGKEDPIQYDNIVVGDIVKIKAGMNIPVDGILIEGSGVTVTEAAMTGESDELKKENIDMCKLRREEKD